METFTGDESLSAYISKLLLCVNYSMTNKRTTFQTGVVFVHKLLLNSTSFASNSDDNNLPANSTLLSRQLLPANCDSNANLYQQIFSPITFTRVLELCQSTSFRRFTYLQLIFDLGSGSFSAFRAFNQLMVGLSEVYHGCLNCLPFILLLGEGQRSTSTLLPTFSKWTTNLLGGTFSAKFRGFRLVLVSSRSVTHQKETVLHLNPILDGCLEFSGVYLPKNAAHFARLKAQKCNLNGSTLSVSISRVIILIFSNIQNFLQF